MEIVQRRSQSAVPLIALVAIVAAAVISIATWSSVHRPTAGSTGATPIAASSISLSPDAADRNAGILATRLGKAELTHGH